ncbi:MAG TPA: thrombospondin type 3 repeat-containing protein [Thermoleophilaceae bacterium]|nr:thrombospondin type 3 repeat-containing protein [Thermoleophilaceae bacterium]
MLSPIRRFVVFAALASLLALIPAAPGGAQATGCEQDRDCDGVSDHGDRFPDDPNEYADTDGDGIGDNADNCPDQYSQDGVQFADLDGDGEGDPCDFDRDGDGVANFEDRFPDDPDESADTDGDGIGDVGDNCPTQASLNHGVQSPDLDGDGKGDPCDDDRDGDGVANDFDHFPDDGTRKWVQPADWADYSACERQYYDKHGTLHNSDCDGDGVKRQFDNCPKYGPAYGNAPSSSNGCLDPTGPEGDNDYDGVANGKDSCPYEGPGSSGLDASGCPITDGDGDGVTDARDQCPNKPANQWTLYNDGCPREKPVVLKDTPAASGPSCAKKPCLVLKRKGLSKKLSGGYADPDATIKVTIALDANGMPARVVDAQLRNVDSHCYHYDENGYYTRRTSGPEVSVNLDPLALKKGIQRHANYNSTVFRFDPFKPVRTIKGTQYELDFYMEKNHNPRREAQLSIFSIDDLYKDVRCRIDINGYNDRLTRAKSGDEEAVERAVAKCKEKPTDTKKQRRKRKKCLRNARD